jgi:RHS repeat-associated protein
MTTNTMGYNGFGTRVSKTDSGGSFSYGGKFGYQSDGDTNLQLLGHRYYDSTAGRFLTRDPICQGSDRHRDLSWVRSR